MNKDRLLRLAALLEADAANPKGMKFDIGTVAEPTSENSKMPAVDCGTTGCAMGLAAVSRIFKEDGLDFSVDPNVKNEWTITLSMHGEELDFDEAAQQLFDIDGDESSYLFSPCAYDGSVTGAKGERLVARRIRGLVGKGGMPDGV